MFAKIGGRSDQNTALPVIQRELCTADGTNGHGGGIYIQGDDNTINIFNNIIWGNSTGASGRDIYLTDTGTVLGYVWNLERRKWVQSQSKPKAFQQLPFTVKLSMH
ncbi:MAG: hypothetical protein JRJ39_03020 [Deltaproteobacteria bacterium]|nr:hypothetical protein [Deltaproteobacteria bacterium]